MGLEADSKKKREEVFKKLDIEAESMPEIPEREEIKYLKEAEYGQSEAADDGYSDPYPEPTAEELNQIEADEKRQAETEIKERRFYGDRGNMGKRGKGHRYTG